MPDELVIRQLLPADVDAAEAVGWAALSPLWPDDFRPADDDVRRARARLRVGHLQQTDPGGCWVAEAGGEIVAIALALIREGVWGFSLFGVHPEHHGRGIGSAVYAPALAYGKDCRGGIILSSEHPAAMRRYATSGFSLRPCVSTAGMLERRGLPAGLQSRPGDLLDEEDRATCAAASRFVRGASHEQDLEACLAAGRDLLVLPGRGFAIHQDGSPSLLAALDEEAATDLLWSVFAAAPAGATVHADFITAGNDWAIDVSLRCRLALSADGPVFVRGDVGPMAPYLPSGAYL
ncbi:MAG: family N-acetyltransferase [Solirubrobacterales bacterium]|nr:family N-acetyltransferase [Solirubrobacterales bacterium]